jgi:protein phosphatase
MKTRDLNLSLQSFTRRLNLPSDGKSARIETHLDVNIKMTQKLDRFRLVFDHFNRLLQLDVANLGTPRLPLSLTQFSSETIIDLCSKVSELFQAESLLLEVQSPLVIVGDIHGQLLDLLRIVKEHGIPTRQRYLFMGDLIDRGPFSLEVIVMIFVLKLYWPQNLLVIRGNHEFHQTCSEGGFYEQIFALYSNGLAVYGSFLNAFSNMPLAAVVDRSIFVVHGGIGPEVQLLRQIQEISRPIDDFSLPIVDSLLWSDPLAQLDEFEPSTRGAGFLFGKTALNTFLADNQLALLVRGHESIAQGFEYQFDKKCLTAFSASNYCGRLENDGSVLIVQSAQQITPKVYHPLKWIDRTMVKITKETEPAAFPPVSGAVASALARNQVQEYTPSIKTRTVKPMR